MSQNRKKQGPGRKKGDEKEERSDYRLFIVLGVAIALALIMGYAVMLTSR